MYSVNPISLGDTDRYKWVTKVAFVSSSGEREEWGSRKSGSESCLGCDGSREDGRLYVGFPNTLVRILCNLKD